MLTLAIGSYLLAHRKKSRKVERKITEAKERGLHEPVSIHPYIDPAKCIGSGACVKSCPEKDIIGLVDGKGKLIHASHCVGHGACAAACPVGAITLVFGTETRGVDIPYVSPDYESNIKGVFIVGELGGMGLIKNAITQGTRAVEYIAAESGGKTSPDGVYDLIIVGAGPAGIGASLMAAKHKLKFVTIEQDDIGGAVLQYPRHKIVMTSPVDLPLYGKVKLKETTKEALLELWMEVIRKTGLKINTHEKMTGLQSADSRFRVKTTKAEYIAERVVLAIGRRGTPRKLGVPGENLPKVAYKLLDPDQHTDANLLVVGGGDSAIEAAMALSCQPGNRVTLSYRGESFSRLKPLNKDRLEKALSGKSLNIMLCSNVKEIREKAVVMEAEGRLAELPNEYVYIFAGGELPNEFLNSIGVEIEKRFGKPAHVRT